MKLLWATASAFKFSRTALCRALGKSTWVPLVALTLLGTEFNATGQISLYTPQPSPSSSDASNSSTSNTSTNSDSSGTSLYNTGTSLYTPTTMPSTNGTSLYTPGTSLYTPGTSLYNTGISLTPGVEVNETAKEVKIRLRGDILFDFDKANIRKSAERTLSQVAELIQKYPQATVRIAGFTDSIGSETYNMNLSERRAYAVLSWLASRGIPKHIMSMKGWGAKHPVAPNTFPDGSDNPEGRQQNRRVEITIKKYA